ncbi:serine/threonine protein kinase [Halomicrobium salinisoli]|uniref:serine/threonine protein kinase n=1 Tax=Halomicrobium salinisoli TaxID=2878391 RepID=UPI001CF09754|nr:serine/threonine protein kinase [Halomicrobium salinisoli]
MDRDRAGPDDPLSDLLGVVESPDRGRRRLPRLVDRLTEPDPAVRIGAAWALCRVARTDPDAVRYVTRRLAGRLDGDAPAELRLLADYLARTQPEGVADALAGGTDGAAAPARGGPLDSGSEANGDGDAVMPAAGDAGSGQSDPAAFDGASSGEAGDGTRGADEAAGPPARDGWAASGELSAIKYASDFDRLTVLAGRRRRRYADVYRALGERDGAELPVGLALFHRPDEGRAAFAEDLAAALTRWATVDDGDGVATLYDWGTEPRPWAVVEYAGVALSDRGRLPPATARWNAERLATALVEAHAGGVVHGGVDPGNVAYYGNVIDEDERQPPLLTNVALMGAVRQHFDPTGRLDPRYAAPEYFDREFGRVDHATDVYGLGAVIYRLFTGEPPYDGDYEAVRRQVMEAPPPLPGDVTDVPDRIDDVVSKAMARRKLRRYESVAQLAADLRAADAGGDADAR